MKDKSKDIKKLKAGDIIETDQGESFELDADAAKDLKGLNDQVCQSENYSGESSELDSKKNIKEVESINGTPRFIKLNKI